MERYHIFKLGWAILFYAAYCIRPTMAENDAVENKTNAADDYLVYYQGVEGRPGIDFPVHSYIPRTGFNCKEMESGYYADLDTDCQVFHICEEGKKISFLCPNGTIFQQSELICEWWFKVNCTNSPSLYEESAEQLREDSIRRKASRRVYLNGQTKNHGAIMRIEEESSVRATKNGKPYDVRLQNRENKRVHNKQNVNNNNYDDLHENLRHNNNDNNNYNANQEYEPKTKPIKHNNYEQRKPEIKNYKQNPEPSNNIKNHRGGSKYHQNQQPLNNFNNQFINTFESPASNNNHDQTTLNVESQYTQPRTINNNNVNTNEKPLRINLNTGSVSTTTTRTLIIAAGQNDEPQFPLHESEQPQRFLHETKSEDIAKPKSTVPLTRNDILTRRLVESEVEESQVPQETGSFYKNSFNSIQDSFKSTSQNPYPNHRTTYSDLKSPTFEYNTNNNNKVSSISSVTPQYITTQSINNGKPFIGSRVGGTVTSNFPTSTTAEPTKSTQFFDKEKSTIILGVIRHSNPITSSTTSTTTSTTSTPPSSTSSSINYRSSNYVTFNNNSVSSVKPILPLSSSVLPSSTVPPPVDKVTKRIIDHATVYGRFVKYTPSTTPAPTPSKSSKIEIRFDKPTSSEAEQEFLESSFNLLPPKLNSYDDGNTIQSTATTNQQTENPNGFFVTKDYQNEVSYTTPSSNGFTLGTSSSTYFGGSSLKTVKPRPFQKQEIYNNNGFTNYVSTQNDVSSSTPKYKISSASPFKLNNDDIKHDVVRSTPTPTLPTPFLPSAYTPSTESNSVYENVDNMINVLMEIANVKENQDEYVPSETPRPGLIIPPSAGPQTLHTLAVYFANALDGIVAENQKIKNGQNENVEEAKEKLTTLLTQMTMNHYEELFKKNQKKASEATSTTPSSAPSSTPIPVTVSTRSNIADEGDNGLEAQHSNNFVQTPQIRQLARNFSLALSSYLDNPETFRKDLKDFRPTEPPPLAEEIEDNANSNHNDEELLNFSDADSKSSYPPIFPTSPSAVPTWSYILALNNYSKTNNLDVKNSLNPDLQGADSQSFVPGFNLVNAEKNVVVKEIKSTDKNNGNTKDLENHWTASPGATKLWQSTFAIDPVHLNEHFETTEPISVSESASEENIAEEDLQTASPINILDPHREIKYELRALPKLSLNSTQVHGILIDFMNTTKTDDDNRLQRILRKLNTTEGEFLTRMKEIESNPLTRRLILLLISECGANVTKDIQNLQKNINNNQETLQLAGSSNAAVATRQLQLERKPEIKSNSYIQGFVDPTLGKEDQDTRALQLLNSLYSIASKFGK